ncbi:unnamed protein product [Debaryomyces fabryi]|nr:unnamed protein product [Debaryomyces fabryi]
MNKKRNRQILVCANCHKKKRKCDRELPCSSCIRLSIESSCSYFTPKRQHVVDDKLNATHGFSEQNRTGINNNLNENRVGEHREDLNGRVETLNKKVRELEALLTTSTRDKNQKPRDLLLSFRYGDTSTQKVEGSSKSIYLNSKGIEGFVGFNPVQLDNQTINFLNTFNTNSNVPVSPYGPLRYLILIKQDPTGILISNYLRSPSLRNFEHFSSPHVADLDKLEEKSRHFYGDSYIKKIGKDHTPNDIIEVKNAISKFGLSRGISLSIAQPENERNLLDKVKLVLPNKKTVNLLINLFFEVLYPHFPILDETTFRSDILAIFDGEINNSQINKIETIKIRNRQDVAVIATLLMLMRLSYLSLFNNDARKNESLLNSENDSLDIRNKKYLLQNPVQLEVINVAKLCIRELDLISLPNLAIFQASLMMQIYQTYSPEEDTFIRTESPVSIGNLYQMANSLFLNRDPDYILYYADRRMDEKMKTLSRRLWYFLITLDIEDSIIYGTQIYTVEVNYDTKIPTVPKKNSDSLMDKETEIVSAIETLHPVIKSAHRILEKIFRVKSDMELVELSKYLSDLEMLVHKCLGTSNDYLNIETTIPRFLKIQKFKLYLYCKIMLLATYFCFYLYYEINGKLLLSFFYLKKLMYTTFSELAGISGNLLDNCDEYFGPGFTLILSPILQIVSRMELLSFLIHLRLKCTQKSIERKLHSKDIKDEELELHGRTLESLLSVFSILMDSNKTFMSYFKDRYYFAWKYLQSIVYGLNITSDDRLYDDEKTTDNASLKYSLNDISDLEKLLTSCVNLKEKNLSSLTSISILDRHRKIDKPSIESRKEGDSMEAIMNDIQVDKLWRLLDLFKQESSDLQFRSIWSNAGEPDVSSVLFPGNLSLENSNVIPPTGADAMYQENDPFRQFGIEDLFFDSEFYMRLNHLH